MITCRQLVNEAFVEIRFAREIGSVHGVKLSFSTDGQRYQPCAIFPSRDVDTFLDCSFWEWNQAVSFGNVRFQHTPHPVYWNLYLNHLQAHRGLVPIRVEALRASGIETFDASLELQPSRAVFVGDWQARIPAGSGWNEVGGCLTVEPGKAVEPIQLRPGVKGRYAVYIGLPHGTLMAHLRVSGELCRHPFIAERHRLEFQDKAYKELLWKTVDLEKDSTIEIAPTPLTVREPKMYSFGAIYYLKLVPVRTSSRVRPPRWNDKTLALYFEPYSWACYYGLHEPWRVKEALTLFRELGATEIHNHIIRFGSKTLHHSRVVERFDSGALMGDDGTFTNEPAAMVRSLDVLRESIAVCRELGLPHYANAGLSNCYTGSDFEERISREHPDWRRADVLRFNRPETRAYAAAVVREFIEWGSDGISIDCMRYPQWQEEEDLLALFHEIHAAIGGRKMPVTVRIPAADVMYYRVFEHLAREGVIHCVIPSNFMTRAPEFSLKPYLKWKDYGCRVFGLIDGWLTHLGTFEKNQLSLYRNPRDIREDITRFFREGADGIYVHQTDQYCPDPFTRTAIDWRQW